MTKSFAGLAALLAAVVAGCAPMCQTPWDYCNAVIGPNGRPNCNFGARYNSAFAPMNGTPASTPIEPTPALEEERAESSEQPYDPSPPVDGEGYQDFGN